MNVRKALLATMLAAITSVGLLPASSPAAAASCTEVQSASGRSTQVGWETRTDLVVDVDSRAQVGVRGCTSGYWGYTYTAYVFEGGTVYASASASGTDNAGYATFPRMRADLPSGTRSVGYGIKTTRYNWSTGQRETVYEYAWRITIPNKAFDTATGENATLYMSGCQYNYAWSEPCIDLPF